MIILWYHCDLLYSLVQSVPEMLHIDWQECIFSNCSVQGLIYAQKIKLVNLLLKFLKMLSFNQCVTMRLCVVCHVWLFVTLRTVAQQSLCLLDFSGKNTGVCCYFLLQGICLTQGSNLCLLHFLHCRQILYLLSHRETFSFNEIHANWYCICQIDIINSVRLSLNIGTYVPGCNKLQIYYII